MCWRRSRSAGQPQRHGQPRVVERDASRHDILKQFRCKGQNAFDTDNSQVASKLWDHATELRKLQLLLLLLFDGQLKCGQRQCTR